MSDVIAKYRHVLEAKQQEHARAAVRRPSDGVDIPFAYGVAVGHDEAFTIALQLLDQIVKEDQDREQRRVEPTKFV